MSAALIETIVAALEDIKGKDITVLEVTELTEVTDYLVVASGTSHRQVKALAENVIEECKGRGHRPLGTEGLDGSEWVLVDFGDAVVHVMLPETRAFYDLEKLWSVRPSDVDTPREDDVDTPQE